jgi:hypothetical protein
MSDDTKWTKEPWEEPKPGRTILSVAMSGEDYERARMCVNLLAAHPDLARVTVVGEAVMEVVREALEHSRRALLEYRLTNHAAMCSEALALIPSATVKE